MINIKLKNKNLESYSFLNLIFIIFILSMLLSINSVFFLKIKNIINIFEASSYKLILATAMTFIICMGGMDLSIGSILSLSGIILALALKNGIAILPSIFLCILSGLFMGIFNGIIIEKTRLNPLIITLGTSWIYRGIALILTKGMPVSRLGKNFINIFNKAIWGLKLEVIFSIIFVMICFPLLNKCKWGHYIKSIGANELALKRTGIKTSVYKIFTYMFMGICASIASIIITSKLNTAEPNAGLGMEFDIITAVIMGGTPLNGGKSSLFGTVLAVFLLSIIRNGLTILSISPFYQQLITGIILLVSVIVYDDKNK